MRISIILLALICFVATTGMAQTMSTLNKTLDDNGKPLNISIQQAQNWQEEENPKAIFILRRPAQTKGDTLFRENCNLTVGGTLGYTEIEKYSAGVEGRLHKMIETLKQESIRYTNINGRKFARIVYAYNANGFFFKALLYQTMINDRVYSFTATTAQDTYPRYEALFDKMAHSLTIR